MKILENKFFNFLLFVLIIVVIGYFIASIDEKSRASEDKTITVSGIGEVYASPDVGLINISVVTENIDLAKATDDNSKTMNGITSFLKGEGGIDQKDIKTTGYNINPRYEYEMRTGKRNLAGYEVSQSVNIKIRDLTKVGKIISESTALGATDVGSLSFTIDDDEQVKQEARDLAIKDAKDKAQKLEKSLGIKMVRIVNFSEGTYPAYDSYYGMGGAEIKATSSITPPTIQTGQNKITSNVSITYSIR
ncbi:MAG: SIMPL domain-containing protein [Candidatus Paceibacterota bacterium]|jgi:hypothetical protein